MRLKTKKQPRPKPTSPPPPPPQGSPRRLETGVPRLDYILEGGLFTGSTYVIMGPPGSGKTVLANHICSNHVGKDQGRCGYVTLLVESHSRMAQVRRRRLPQEAVRAPPPARDARRRHRPPVNLSSTPLRSAFSNASARPG